MSESDQSIDELIARLHGRLTKSEREAFQDQAVHDLEGVREKLLALLQASGNEETSLQLSGPSASQRAKPLDAAARTPHSTISAEQFAVTYTGKSRVIDRYKLLQLIGEGGMGSVFLAEQEQPVRRQVALKIVKAGMDSKQVIARFEAERQALSMMQHNNIARVFDAGKTEQGRPYFVMELIKGVPITQYCDQHNVPVARRLELFESVCDGVQHAHQKGIIHRDLKPSNILVAELDGHPVPKVIDFGLAKALDQRLTDTTMFTQIGQVLGTLEYMSPEQSTLNQLSVDTRTDIYSLGVILYELLTGTVPFDKKRLRSIALDQVLKLIREEQPRKPSDRFSANDSSKEIAGDRGTDETRLQILLRGDLDWIVMKAIEKERSRRFQTANELSADIRRFLNKEPVTARPPTPAYKVRKFVQRNRASVLVAGLLLFSLVLGVIGTSTGMFWAISQQQLAASEAEQRRKTLYLADLGAIQRAWEQGMLERVRELLDSHIPDDDQSDLRSFEWYYYDQLCRRAAQIPKIDFGEKVSAISIAPNQKTIAVTGNSNRLDIYDLVSKKRLQTLSDKPSIAKRLLHSTNSSVLLSLGGNWVTAWKFNDASSQFDPIVQRQVSTPGDTQVSANGRYIVIVQGSTLWVYDTTTDQGATIAGDAEICSFVFVNDEQILASFQTDTNSSRILLMDLGTEQVKMIYQADEPPGRHLLLSDDRKHLVTINDDEARVFDVDESWALANPMRLKVFPLEADLRHLQSNRTFLAISGNEISSWSFDAPEAIARRSTSDQFSRQAEVGHDSRLAQKSQAIAVCMNQNMLALSAKNNRIELVDVPDFNLVGSRHGHQNAIYGLQFLNERELVSCSRDQTVRFWTEFSFEEYKLYRVGSRRLWSVAISPDSTKLACASEEAEVTLWNLVTGQQITKLKSEGWSTQFVRFSPDGNYLLFGGYDQKVHVYDLSSFEECAILTGHTGTINSFSFSPDGQHLLTGSDDSTIILWDWRTGKQLKSTTVPNQVHDRPAERIWAVCCSKTGSDVYFGGTNDTLFRWNYLESDSCEEVLHLKENLTSLNISPDNQHLAVTTSDGKITIWDTAARTAETLISHSSDAMFTAFSPDGRTLVSGSSDGQLQFRNTESFATTVSLQAHEQHIHAVTFSDDGSTVATASWDGTVKVFQTK